LQAARKPDSVLDDHSSRRRVTAPLQQPTRKFRQPGRSQTKLSCLSASGRYAGARWRVRAPSLPIWSCSVWGLPCGVHCWPSGALLPHLFTLTAPLTRCGGIFSVALAVFAPSSANPGRYPAHCPAESGLSSPSRHAGLVRPGAGGGDHPAACFVSVSRMQSTRCSSYATPRSVDAGRSNSQRCRRVQTKVTMNMDEMAIVHIAIQKMRCGAAKSPAMGKCLPCRKYQKPTATTSDMPKYAAVPEAVVAARTKTGLRHCSENRETAIAHRVRAMNRRVIGRGYTSAHVEASESRSASRAKRS